MLIHTGTCTPMFGAALSTVDKLWKEPKCPSTNEWRKRMWFIYTTEYYLAMRKNEILAATWMELEGIMLSEVSKSGRETQIAYVFTHMWILRNLTEDHGGREGEKIVSNREGGKPIRDS